MRPSIISALPQTLGVRGEIEGPSALCELSQVVERFDTARAQYLLWRAGKLTLNKRDLADFLGKLTNACFRWKRPILGLTYR
jgi:hypothetical protein